MISKWRGIRFLLMIMLCTAGNPGLASDTVRLHLPKYRLHAGVPGVIIVIDDPLGVRIGDYYRKARNIPAGNRIRIGFEPGCGEPTATNCCALRETTNPETHPQHHKKYRQKSNRHNVPGHRHQVFFGHVGNDPETGINRQKRCQE